MIDIKTVKNSRLFAGIDENDLKEMLSCLGANLVSLKKGEYVLRAGDEISHIGIVQAGALHIIKDDIDGERSLIASLGPSDYFGEALCCAEVKESPVSVEAQEGAEVILLDFRRMLNTCPSSCSFHSKLIQNMLKIVALKNLELQARMGYLSKKTIRKRVIKYLQSFSKGPDKVFSIPLNREGLADYLCIDRSALSRELIRLKEEGVIDYWKNQFKLL